MGAGQTGQEDRVANLSIDIKHSQWPETVPSTCIESMDLYTIGVQVLTLHRRSRPLQPWTIYHN